MQDYISIATKNGITLIDSGSCQFCGAQTERGIHECLEVFNLSFNEIDFSLEVNHLYRFLLVDAHALQHPEIHGRWSNHFHLCRLHLIFKYGVNWSYHLSPKLSLVLNRYKASIPTEILQSPDLLRRGNITSVDIIRASGNGKACMGLIKEWATEVYRNWEKQHERIDALAKEFLIQA